MSVEKKYRRQCCSEMVLDRYEDKCGCITEYCYNCEYMGLTFACYEHYNQEEE